MNIIEKLKKTYKLWHEFLPHFPKTSRYTLGAKIDSLFIDLFELTLTANYLPREQKLSFILKTSSKLDLLKFFVQVCWEIKSLDNKKYIILSGKLEEVGKMIGGWIKGFKK